MDWRVAGVLPVTLIGDTIHVLALVNEGELKLLKGRRLPPEIEPIAAAGRVLSDKGAIDAPTDLGENFFDVPQCKMRVYYPVVEPTDAATDETVRWVPLYAIASTLKPSFPFIMARSGLKRVCEGV